MTIEQEFKKRRRKFLVSIGLSVAGITLLMVTRIAGGATREWVIGIVLCALVVRHMIWRCPKCNGFLGTDVTKQSCRSCGKNGV